MHDRCPAPTPAPTRNHDEDRSSKSTDEHPRNLEQSLGDPTLRRRVLAQARHMERADYDPHDHLQTVLMRAWERRDRYDPTLAPPATWVLGIGRNILLERARKARRDRRNVEAMTQVQTVLDARLADANPFAPLEAKADLSPALATLSQEQLRALELFHGEEMTIPEIAPVVDATPSAVKSRIWHARRRLARAIEAREGHGE